MSETRKKNQLIQSLTHSANSTRGRAEKACVCVREKKNTKGTSNNNGQRREKTKIFILNEFSCGLSWTHRKKTKQKINNDVHVSLLAIVSRARLTISQSYYKTICINLRCVRVILFLSLFFFGSSFYISIFSQDWNAETISWNRCNLLSVLLFHSIWLVILTHIHPCYIEFMCNNNRNIVSKKSNSTNENRELCIRCRFFIQTPLNCWKVYRYSHAKHRCLCHWRWISIVRGYFPYVSEYESKRNYVMAIKLCIYNYINNRINELRV